MPARKDGRLRPSARPARRRRRRRAGSTTARLLALQGPAAAAVLSRLVAGIAQLPFMSAAETTSTAGPAWSRARGYTGEDGFEISVPAAGAEPVAERLLGRTRDRSRSASAPAIRCAWKPGCASMATISTRRRPRRGRSRLDHRQEAARGSRLSGRRDHSAPARRGACAQARRHPPRRPRSGARRNSDRRFGRARNRPGDQRRLRPLAWARRWRWAMSMPPMPPTGTRSGAARARHRAPGPRRPPALCPAPLPPRLMQSSRPSLSPQRTADDASRFTKDHEWVRLDGDHRHRRHHRLRRSRNWATWSLSNCRRSGRRVEQGGKRRWWKASRRPAKSMPRSRARSRRSTTRSPTTRPGQ